MWFLPLLLFAGGCTYRYSKTSGEYRYDARTGRSSGSFSIDDSYSCNSPEDARMIRRAIDNVIGMVRQLCPSSAFIHAPALEAKKPTDQCRGEMVNVSVECAE